MDLANFTDVLGDADEIGNSQPLSLSLSPAPTNRARTINTPFQRSIDISSRKKRPPRRTGLQGDFRSVEEIDEKYRDVFIYPYFNLVQSSVIDDALYTDKSMVVCAPTGSGKTVIFEMAIVQLLMDLDDKNYTGDFKIIYMAPVKALCTERLSEWYPKFTKLGLMCIEVTGDTTVDFSQLKPYRIIITTPEKWDLLTRRWRDHKSLVEVIKLFLIDEVHILNDNTRGPVLEAVVSRMKTIESSSQSAHRIEQLQKQYQGNHNSQDYTEMAHKSSLPVRIRFVAVSATISNPEDVAAWLGASDKPAVFYKFGDECRPVKLKRVVEGYPCSEGTSIFKFDIILNYKLWPIIQKYHNGKPTLIFCNTRKSVAMTADTLSRELTVGFTAEQQARLASLASTIKNKKLQALVLSGVGCHHAGLLYEERLTIEKAFRNRDLPILITTTTLAMGVNLPAHLVIIKNTQQYVNGAYQEYSISTVMQMVGRAGRPQFDTEATAVIMTRLQDKPRYQALVGGDEPLQSYLHKRLAENLNSEAALGTVCDVAQCVQWLRSTFLSVRAAKDPKRYLGLPQNAQPALISKKIEELCVKAMNGLATAGLITMDEASCIESTEAGRLMSVFYLDLETMKHIMKIEGKESLEQLLWIVCECHELADMHLRVDERRTLNTLNRNNAAPTIRFPMKGKVNTRQMKLSCVIQAILGCLPIPDPSLNQEAMKVMKIADRVCKCLVAYVTRPDLISSQPQYFTAVVNALTLAKCVEAHLWENSPYVSKQLKGIGPTFSSLLATAGKVNLALLEESHPRDLERIMNKGAPAGNVLRKQISLLPKYQLTTTPIDEKRINVQLLLLNQHQLAENREQLTAGDSHKCYIVVGDSENYLLLFTSFKDKDLINIYGGGLAYEVTRKHNFEHKIQIHCISSNWVGIDVQCDYIFKNIEPAFLRGEAINPSPTQDHDISRKTTKKQTSITDVYKVRKRKNNEIDITESKEKKKRDTALVEKFKLLKNSFEVASKEIKDDLDKSAQMSNMIINEMIQPDKCDRQKGLINRSLNMFEIRNDKLHLEEENNVVDKNYSVAINDYDNSKLESLDDEENFVVDDHINTIMNEIETEIYKSNNETPTCDVATVMKVPMSKREQPKTNYKVQSEFFITPEHHSDNDNAQPSISGINYFPSTGLSIKKKRKPVSTKTNYSFIDSIEKNINDNYEDIPQDNSGFSDTIKSQIEKFLQRTVNTKQNDTTIKRLLDGVDNTEKIGSYQIAESAKSETINELPDVNMNLNKGSNDKITLEDIYSVHKDNINNKEIKEAFMPNYTQNIDIEREHNVSTKESISLKHEINNLRTNYMKNHSNLRHDESLKQISVSKNNNNKTSEKNKDNNGENIHEQQYHQRPNSENKSTRDKNMFKISSEEEMEKNHDALKETNFQSNISNSLIPVNENLNYLSNSDKNVEYLYKSRQGREPFVDGKATKLHIKGEICDQNLRSQQLHTVPLCLSLTPKAHVLLDNLDSNSKANKEDSNMYSNKNMLSIPTKNEPSLQIPNYSDFSNNNYTFDQTYKNSAENEKNNDYINRYFFTATKMDVCTKNMSDHQIQIIRKLKLDLDVTEVVSKGNNRSTNGTTTPKKQEVQNYQTNSKSIGNKEHFYSDSDCGLVNVLQNFAINEDVPVKYKENKIYTLQREETINEAYKYLTDVPKSLTSKSQKQTINNKVAIKDNINKESLSQEEILNQKVENITDKQNKSDDLEQYKKYLREIAAANAVSATEEKVTAILTETEDKDIVSDNNIISSANAVSATEEKVTAILTETEDKDIVSDNNVIQNKQQLDGTNKIENILQKYSAVLRKNNNVLNTSTTDKNINNDNITRQCNEKSKKPYKISEILNLHIPLPKSLIAVEASRNHRSSNKDILKRMLDIKRNIEVTTPKEIDNSRANKDIANTNSIAYAEDIPDVPDYHSPVADNPLGENTEDYNLDQSMLNPKILLEQCFSRDENNYDDDEIIPPPSGFCDNERLYSPVTMQGDNLVDFTCLKNYSKGVVATTHDQSFGDSSVLTPEIETWTLSQDNTTDYFQKPQTTEEYCADDDNHGQYNFKSLTVMRRNSIKDRYSSKLGQFNFTPKNKM